MEINNVNTFLDQEEIRAGDLLPQTIQEGISSCDKFLLIWSRHAADSEWVEREWLTAFELRKRIIPYKIDFTPLPDALQNFVYIQQEDQEHGNAELFREVLGKLPAEVKGVDIFPGHWEAEVDISDGSGNQGLYKLEFRPNGQVAGEAQAKPTGVLGWVSGEVGRDGLDLGYLFQPIPVWGKWAYTYGSGLRLDLEQTAFGQHFRFTVQVLTTGKKQNVLYGTGPGGSRWTLRRTDLQSPNVY